MKSWYFHEKSHFWPTFKINFCYFFYPPPPKKFAGITRIPTPELLTRLMHDCNRKNPTIISQDGTFKLIVQKLESLTDRWKPLPKQQSMESINTNTLQLAIQVKLKVFFIQNDIFYGLTIQLHNKLIEILFFWSERKMIISDSKDKQIQEVVQTVPLWNMPSHLNSHYFSKLTLNNRFL